MAQMTKNRRPGPGVQGRADDKKISADWRLGHAAKCAPHAVVAAHLGFGTGRPRRLGERIVPVLPLGRATTTAYHAKYARGSPPGIIRLVLIFIWLVPSSRCRAETLCVLC